MRRWPWIAGAGLLLLAMLLGWFLLPRQAVLAPVDPSPFIRSFTFVRHDDNIPVGDVVEFPIDAGFYADLTYVPNPSPPKQVNDLDVQDSHQWPMAIVIYSRFDPDKQQAARCPFFWYDQRIRPLPKRFQALGRRQSPTVLFRSVPMGTSGFWGKKEGYKGVLEPPKSWPKEEVRLWTFFAYRFEEPGEYIYEVHVYPTAQYLSPVRLTRGEPVVVKRGLLKVLPKGVTSDSHT